MSKYVIQENVLSDIANAIRCKTLGAEKIKVSNMSASINEIKKVDFVRGYIEGTATDMNCSSVISIRNDAFNSFSNIVSVNFPEVISVGNHAFNFCRKLVAVDFASATTVDSYAFNYCEQLSTAYFPNATNIGNYAFAYCLRLTTLIAPNVINIQHSAFRQTNFATADFPMATNIGSYVFDYCKDLTTVNLPAATDIGQGAFMDCNNLTVMNVPNMVNMGNSAFCGCRRLTSINLPSMTSISYGAFSNCESLITVNAPLATIIYNNAFTNCTNLTTINNLSTVVDIGFNSFFNCTNLTTVDFPEVDVIKAHAFDSCTNLTTVNFPNLSTIYYNAFRNCKNLSTLILPNTTKMCNLGNYSAIINTPIYNGNGGIVVASELLENYKTANQWNYFANYIYPIDNFLVINQIDNKALSFGETISAFIQCFSVSQNLSISVTSSDTNIVNINNIAFDGNHTISFDISALTVEGSAEITVSVEDENSVTRTMTFTVNVYESIECTWSVEAVDGATYGFELNDDGYYKNTNPATAKTYAICKVVLNSSVDCRVYLDCISSSSYPTSCFGILSKIDTTLALSSSTDSSSNVFKSFYNSSSASVQTIDYGVVESGEHCIYVKYKTGSRTSISYNSGTLRFAVRLVYQ